MRHAETFVTVPVVSRAKPPISNKLLGTATVKFPSRSPPRRNWGLNNATSLCGALANPKPPDSARNCSRGDPGVRLLRDSKKYQRRERGSRQGASYRFDP